jgi:hypothetical protein
MKTLENLFDIFTTQESDLLEHKGRFIGIQNSKRTSWNNRRNYGV